MTTIITFLFAIFFYSLVSGRLSSTVLTGPIIFTSLGLVYSFANPEFAHNPHLVDMALHLAEIGLVFLLFSDASRTNLKLLSHIKSLPARLLSSGMLLTIALGAILAKSIFPELSWWEAGIIGAILAPTDAGLGQVIVNDARVPLKVRQALNVEAGLNDGLSVPFLLFFMAMTGVGSKAETLPLANFMFEQLGIGTAIGIVFGLLGGYLIGKFSSKDWINHHWQPLGLAAIPALCLLFSELYGASMFIAAFVAGLCILIGFKDVAKHSIEFTEGWGQILNLSVFTLFGAICARDWQQFELIHFGYAILSLTVIRMLPVALALIGSRLSLSTVIFMGWFGPRGLASIVLGLIYFIEAHRTVDVDIKFAVITTVLCSIFLHGLSASPGIKVYAKRVKRLEATAPEHG